MNIDTLTKYRPRNPGHRHDYWRTFWPLTWNANYREIATDYAEFMPRQEIK